MDRFSPLLEPHSCWQEYPYGKLHKAVPAGSGVILDGHDARGHSDWIIAVEENPHILMPNNAQ